MTKTNKIYTNKYLKWITQYLLILIFMSAFFLRIAPNIYLEWRQPGWHADNINEMEFYYDDVARSLISGKGFVHSVNPRSENSLYKFEPETPFRFVPPLYAWWLGLVYFIFGPNVLAAKIFQCLMDAFVCLLIYKVGKITTNNNKTSLLASFLYAVYPLAIYTSTRLYYQIPMNLALCWLIISFASPVNLKNGMWTGIAMALSALAKPVTLPFLFLIPIVRILEGFKEKIPIQSSLLWSVSFLLAASITLAPWTIRNYSVFHRFIPIQDGATFPLIQGSKEEYIDMDVNKLFREHGQNFGAIHDQFAEIAAQNHLNHLKEAPLDYLRFLGKKFLLTWYNTEGKIKNFLTLLIQIPFLVFALFGLAASFKFWFKKPSWYILGLISFITGIQVIFFPLARYTLSVMPLVMILAASGIIEFLKILLGVDKRSIDETQ